jgi:hypothetical protein
VHDPGVPRHQGLGAAEQGAGNLESEQTGCAAAPFAAPGRDFFGNRSVCCPPNDDDIHPSRYNLVHQPAPMFQGPALGRMRGAGSDRDECTIAAKPGLPKPGSRLGESVRSETEIRGLAIGTHVEASGGCEVAFGNRPMHGIPVAFPVDEERASRAILRVSLPGTGRQDAEDTAAQVIVKVEQV